MKKIRKEDLYDHEEAKAIREREHYDRIGFITSADEDLIEEETTDEDL